MNDKVLIEKLAKADSTAFEYLYKEYFKMAEYFIVKNSGNSADAQDVFQDALVVLYEKTFEETFTLTCALKTYLYSIVRNLWLNKLRANKKKANVIDFEKFIAVADEEVEEDLKEVKLQQIEDALKKLGENCRKIITQYYYYKKKMKDIAEEMGYTNAENVKNQKYKCMQKLKKLLNRE